MDEDMRVFTIMAKKDLAVQALRCIVGHRRNILQRGPALALCFRLWREWIRLSFGGTPPKRRRVKGRHLKKTLLACRLEIAKARTLKRAFEEIQDFSAHTLLRLVAVCARVRNASCEVGEQNTRLLSRSEGDEEGEEEGETEDPQEEDSEEENEEEEEVETLSRHQSEEASAPWVPGKNVRRYSNRRASRRRRKRRPTSTRIETTLSALESTLKQAINGGGTLPHTLRLLPAGLRGFEQH